jgi:hypothetical protein
MISVLGLSATVDDPPPVIDRGPYEFGAPKSVGDDCNRNGLMDACETLADPIGDCNANSVPDSCDFLATTAADCNFNGTLDGCDIASGFSTDINNNGIPDECDGIWLDDVDRSQIVDLADLIAVLGEWGSCTDCATDVTQDGVVDSSDLLAVIRAWHHCH